MCHYEFQLYALLHIELEFIFAVFKDIINITNITCLHCFMQELWQHENFPPFVAS